MNSLVNDERVEFLARVAKAVREADEILAQETSTDRVTLLHTFLSLDLSPSERLARSLERSGNGRLYRS